APSGRTGGAAPGSPGRAPVVGWGEGGGAAGRLGCRALPVLRRWASDRIVPAATATRTPDRGAQVQRTRSRGTGGKGSSPTAPGPLVSDSGRGRLGRGRLGRGRLGCRRHAAGAGPRRTRAIRRRAPMRGLRRTRTPADMADAAPASGAGTS